MKRTNAPVSTCKGCGEEIAWLRTANGKAIPVNPDSIDDPNAMEFDPKGGHESHFATCPAADEFTSSSRYKEEPTLTETEYQRALEEGENANP